uniref:uncharacterized protein LOC122592150 n=1 Tax=Erigeron canadensis TaxID=72917 RepID=UPI001CB91537|nr:uncharacterized protein LOC122592150 [Erigeron canadensis]
MRLRLGTVVRHFSSSLSRLRRRNRFKRPASSPDINLGNLFDLEALLGSTDTRSEPPTPEPEMNEFDRSVMEMTKAVAPTPGSAIVLPNLGDSFSVKGHHLKLIQDNQYDGRAKSDPHKHVSKFTGLCKMFKYGGDVTEDNVKLSLFSSSLIGEARVWFDELDEGTITTWNQLREEFVSRFFPSSLARKMLRDIKAFNQDKGEALVDALKRLREMIRNCHENGLPKDEIMEIFFYGLTKTSQKDLDLAGGDNFLYKSTNDAYKMMQDMVQASLARDMDDKDRDRRPRRTVASIKSSSETEVYHELKALSDRLSTFEGRLEVMDKDLKVIAHGCNKCGGLHYTEDCEEEATEQVNFVQNQYRGGGYQRGLFLRNPGNSHFNSSSPRINNGSFQNRWQRSNDQPEKPRVKGEVKEDPIAKLTHMMERYMDMNDKRHDSLASITKTLNEKISNLNQKVGEGSRNQQATIKELERRIDRCIEQNPRKENSPSPRQVTQGDSSLNPSTSQKYQPPIVRSENVNIVFTEDNDSNLVYNDSCEVSSNTGQTEAK